MKIINRRFYIIIVPFLLLPVMYMGLKNWIGKPTEVIGSSLPPKKVGISDLMESMDIYSLKEPQKAPDFELMSIEGDPVQLSQYHGKVVLVSFWATW